MQCPLDEKILLDLLESELDGQPAAEVAEHLASCVECSAALARLRSIRRAVRDRLAALGLHRVLVFRFNVGFCLCCHRMLSLKDQAML